MPDMNTIVGSHDILMITLDTLRYDVAKLEEQHCPNLCGSGSWEKRHTPGALRTLHIMLSLAVLCLHLPIQTRHLIFGCSIHGTRD